MSQPASFGVYESDGSLIDCARWIIFLRAWCLIRSPACVYTIIDGPEIHNVGSNIKIAPVPAYVSNIICDLFSSQDHGLSNLIDVDAREPSRQSDSLPIVFSALKRRRGAWHYGDDRMQLCERSMRLAVRTVMPWAMMRIHKDNPCGGRFDMVVAALSKLVAVGYNRLSQKVDVGPAPLTMSEARWVTAWAGQCKVPIKGIYDGRD